MQNYAAIFFLRWAPFLDWNVMWNCPYTQIFSLIQPIVKAKPYMQHFASFMQQICSIMLQFFVFEMSTPFRLVCFVKLLLFLNFYPNTSNCKGKNLYAAFWQLYAENMQHYAAKFFFVICTPSISICHKKLPLFLNF